MQFSHDPIFPWFNIQTVTLLPTEISMRVIGGGGGVNKPISYRITSSLLFFSVEK